VRLFVLKDYVSFWQKQVQEVACFQESARGEKGSWEEAFSFHSAFLFAELWSQGW
jgi:hypothetical protein